MVADTGSFLAVPGDGVVQVSAVLALAILIWGAVFMSKPVITVTPDALVWPSGKTVSWTAVTKVDEGQTTATIASANEGARSVVHEVVRVYYGENEMIKIVTTWAAGGPKAANDLIIAPMPQPLIPCHSRCGVGTAGPLARVAKCNSPFGHNYHRALM